MSEIRNYKESDRDRLRYICKETAWDSYKTDANKLECVPIIYHDYFTENEPQYCFVATDEKDEAVGYIVCSADYRKFKDLMSTVYRERVKKYASAEVALIDWFLMALEKVEDRPVHYHINLLPQAQRQGLGRKLIDTLCKKLQDDGYTSLTGCCTKRSSDGYKMYRKCGFEEIYDYGEELVSINRKFSQVRTGKVLTDNDDTR